MNYKNLLYNITEATIASTSLGTIIVPKDKELYPIDLNTRKISAPERLSIEDEHYAETIYFLVDRYYDSMDLAQTNCVIQYIVGDKSYIYPVPFCDTSTYQNKIIIPWSISMSVTQQSGPVQFFIRFYLINQNSVYDTDGTYNPDNAEFLYNLSTLPATTRVEKTLSKENWAEAEKEFPIPDEYFTAISYLDKIVENATVYWEDV